MLASSLRHSLYPFTSPERVSLQNLKSNGSLVRAGLGACIAHAICVSGVSFAADRVGVQTVVRGGNETRCGEQRKTGIQVNTVPGRIVVFLGDVDLRVSLKATQHDKAKTATTEFNRARASGIGTHVS